MTAQTTPRLALPLLCPRCAAVPGREEIGEADADWIVSQERTTYVSYPVIGLRLDDIGEVEAIEDELHPDDSSGDSDTYYPERPMGSKHGLIVRDRECWAAFLVTVENGAVVLVATDDADIEYNGH